MPSIGRIQSTNFQALLTSLGITRNQIPFDLRSEVTPVVLVGGTVSFIAPPTPAYRVADLFTAGALTNPAANTVLSDTGPLPVAAYTLKAFLTAGADMNFAFEWRNAANAANLLFQRFSVLATTTMFFDIRFNIETASERFRILNEFAPGAGIAVQGTLAASI